MKKNLFVMCLFAALSLHAVDLTVSPTNIAWNESRSVDLTLSNLTETAAGLRLYVDLDENGAIDSNDFFIAEFELTDGERNPFGADAFVDDQDGLTNGVIQTSVPFYGTPGDLLHVSGRYVWLAAELDASGEPVAMTTVPFAVTQPTNSVWISGEVKSYTPPGAPIPGDPIPGAYVGLEYFADCVGAAPAVWADTNGQFRIDLPAGVSTSDVLGVWTSAKGMMSAEENPDNGDSVSMHLFTNALSVGENALPGPLYTVAATESFDLYEIRGTVLRVDGGQTATVSGVMVDFDEDDGDTDVLSWDISDDDGVFTLVAPGGYPGDRRDLFCDSLILNMRGLLGTAVEVEVTGTVSDVEIVLLPVEAMARTRVTDRLTGTPVEGVEICLANSNETAVGCGATASNGWAEIGLRTGTYEAECEDDSLLFRYYLRPDPVTNITVAANDVHTNTSFELTRGAILSGRVADTNGVPLQEGMVVLLQDGGGWEQWITDTDVRYDGYYNLLSPTGTVYLRTSDFGDYIIDLYYTNHYVCDLSDADPVTVPTGGVSGLDFYLPNGARVAGTVEDVNFYGVDWTGVDALVPGESNQWICLGGTYTDHRGEFDFAVPAHSNVYLRTHIDYNRWIPRTWYGSVCSPDLASVLSLTNQVAVSNLVIQVEPGYRANVNVLDQNGKNGISGARVMTFDASSNRYETAGDDGSGYCSLYLPTNVALKVRADADGYEGEFYDNVYNAADAAGVRTSVYNEVHLNLELYATAADSDGDGLPDYQEDTVPDGLYSNGVDYADYQNPDTDGDDFDDSDEYGAGTDPQDGDSLFELIDADFGEIGWTSVSGRQYRVQQCTNLISGTWSNIYTVTADGPATAYTNTGSAARGFFRIQVVEP